MHAIQFSIERTHADMAKLTIRIPDREATVVIETSLSQIYQIEETFRAFREATQDGEKKER